MVIASTGALLSNNIRAAKSCSPWAAICKAAKPFLVFETIEALCASSVSMTSTWPERAAQCNGVKPSRVVTSIRAFFFNKSFILGCQANGACFSLQKVHLTFLKLKTSRCKEAFCSLTNNNINNLILNKYAVAFPIHVGQVVLVLSASEQMHARHLTIDLQTDHKTCNYLRISGLIGNLFQSNGETKDNGEKDPEPML
ncbi:hypothetical protein GQX74_014675 [Glossina fuscipes]|nr:hypothetical protein GQX74_014675 [Glossina fuscipes]